MLCGRGSFNSNRSRLCTGWSGLLTEPSALCTEPSALCTEPSALCTESSGLCTEPSALCTEPSVLSPESSVLCTEPSVLCTESSALSTESSVLSPVDYPVSHRVIVEWSSESWQSRRLTGSGKWGKWAGEAMWTHLTMRPGRRSKLSLTIFSSSFSERVEVP